MDDVDFYYFGLSLDQAESAFDIAYLIGYFYDIHFPAEDSCDFRSNYLYFSAVSLEEDLSVLGYTEDDFA